MQDRARTNSFISIQGPFLRKNGEVKKKLATGRAGGRVFVNL